MLALTPCWYNREHRPDGHRQRQGDGSWASRCRYCERAIARYGKGKWSLSDGFDVTRLGNTGAARYLYLFDPADDFIVARFALGERDEEQIETYKAELGERYGLNLPENTLQLRDSADAP